MSLPIVAPAIASDTTFTGTSGVYAIGIDAGVTYAYIVPATSDNGDIVLTVDPHADFVLAITDNRVLSVRYTGAPPTSTPYPTFDITIHIANSSGTVDQTITFAVFGSARRRFYPSITSPGRTIVDSGKRVSLLIGSDVRAQSVGAAALPTGLKLLNGSIVGVPPTDDATYAIALFATQQVEDSAGNITASYTAVRYWLLQVGDGDTLTMP